MVGRRTHTFTGEGEKPFIYIIRGDVCGFGELGLPVRLARESRGETGGVGRQNLVTFLKQKIKRGNKNAWLVAEVKDELPSPLRGN